MKVMTVGLGVIGSIYASVFQEAGHEVEHFIRESKRNSCPKVLNIEMLDGRYSKTGIEKNNTYKVNIAQKNSTYDFIFISVSAGKLEGVIKSLNENNIKGTLVIFCGIWENRNYIEKVLEGWDYILGYPVAGGNFKNKALNGVIFDHIMLESRNKATIKNYDLLLQLFASAGVDIECPYDMLEWIWIHMAINAAVVSVAGKNGDISDTSKSAENAMNSPKILSETVRAIRETINIIGSRGVDIKKYKEEIAPYKIPAPIAGIVMSKMFQKNELTRKIMLLHSNIDDLLYVCKSVYCCGKENHIDAPIFNNSYNEIISR